MITCVCPECEEELEVSDRKLGKMVTCPDCGEEFEAVEKRRKKKTKRRQRDDDDDDSDELRLDKSDLRQIALFQRGILFCILIYFGLVISQFIIPEDKRMILLIIAVPVVIASAVFMFMLANKLYGGVGILLAILTLVPLLGLLILLIVNGKATSVLKKKGYRVGLLGASLSQFDDDEDEDD